MKFDTIILAAGKSSRMGQDKALMEVDGSACVDIHLEKLMQVSDRIIVVLGGNFDKVNAWISQNHAGNSRILPVFNAQHERGMFSSVQEGFRHVSDHRPILLQMVDQPGVPLQVYKQLARCWDSQYRIMQPGIMKDGQMQKGHPLVFHPGMIEMILRASPDSILRDIVDGEDSRVVEVDFPGILQNLNSPREMKTQGVSRFV